MSCQLCSRQRGEGTRADAGLGSSCVVYFLSIALLSVSYLSSLSQGSFTRELSNEGVSLLLYFFHINGE